MTPEKGQAPLEVKFDASNSKAPAGEIVSYEWDFNEDNVFTDAEGKTVTHTFEQVGTYKIGLRITDNSGQYKVITKTLEVQGDNVPVPVIELQETDDGHYYVNTSYKFNANKTTTPNGEIISYTWDFGDNTAKTKTKTAIHTYKEAGEYEINLTVKDNKNKEASTTKTITIENKESAPKAKITTTPSPEKDKNYIQGTAPFKVDFDATQSKDNDNNIVDYKWDFNADGEIDATGSQVSFTYEEAGDYNATLTVIDAENNESKATIEVKVDKQPIQAKLVANPTNGTYPLTVTFDASSSTYKEGEIVSYRWDFGDGSPERIDDSKVTYKYTKVGTFTAKVTAVASDGSEGTAEIAINVRPIALTACFTATPEKGPAPLEVELDPYCSKGTISKYEWDFGDGEISRKRKPIHKFENPGAYEVELKVTDNQNVINTFKKTVLVTGTL